MLSNGSVCCCCCSRYTDNFLYNVMKLHPTGLELLFGWSVMNPLVQIIHKILQRISQHQSCSYFMFVSWDHSILLTFWVTSCISIMYMYLYIDVCRCIFFFFAVWICSCTCYTGLYVYQKYSQPCWRRCMSNYQYTRLMVGFWSWLR